MYNFEYSARPADQIPSSPGRNIFPLLEVIEDPEENSQVRICAVNALVEMKYTSAIEELEVSETIVQDEEIRREIRRAIEKLQK